MKKIISYLYCLFAMTVAMMTITACSNDMEPNVVQNEGIVEFSISTSLPSDLTTYATQGLNSAQGGLQNLAGKGYYVRYIMEAYPETSDNMALRMIKYNELTTPEEVRNVTFEARLLAAKYRFVFYADIVRKVNLSGGTPTGLNVDCYGNQYFLSNIDETSDVLYRPVYLGDAQEGSLQTIQAASQAYNSSYGHTSLEQYDVYTCKGEVDLRTETTGNFTLKRPFAKLRLITTDCEESDVLPERIQWNKTQVSLSCVEISEKLNNSYNALTETPSQNGLSYYNTVNKTTTKETDTYDAENNNGERTLGVFYIPVGNESVNLKFQISLYADDKEFISNAPIEVMTVPLAKNKLTTIKGKLLTKKVVNSITIDENFQEPAPDDIILGQEASNVEELKNTLNGKSESIEYTGRVTKEEGLTINFDEFEAKEATTYSSSNPMYPTGNEATLNIVFSNIEEGAIITFTGKDTPKNLKITTSTKCSLRINMPNTAIYYDGANFANIITNADFSGKRADIQYDALFVVGNNHKWFPSNTVTSHLIFNLDENFKLTNKSKCNFAIDHEGETCSFFKALQDWSAENPNQSMWEYIAEND